MILNIKVGVFVFVFSKFGEMWTVILLWVTFKAWLAYTFKADHLWYLKYNSHRKTQFLLSWGLVLFNFYSLKLPCPLHYQVPRLCGPFGKQNIGLTVTGWRAGSSSQLWLCEGHTIPWVSASKTAKWAGMISVCSRVPSNLWLFFSQYLWILCTNIGMAQ